MIDLSKFTKQQADIITSPIDQNLHIVAGAGTGKTQTLAGRVCHICELTGQPEKVWALSFTNAASREFSERINELAGRHLGVLCSTIHGLAFRLLKQISQQFYGLQNVPQSVTVLSPAQSLALFTSIRLQRIEALKEEGKDDSHASAKTISKLISYMKSRNARLTDNLESIFGVDDLTIDCWSDYEAHCIENDLFDFNDLIGRLNLILERNPSICEWAQTQVDFLFVDEFQDVSVDQAVLVDTLSKQANLCVVGDDAQAIYDWRGADATQFASYANRSDFVRKNLNYNFRSHAGILHVSNLVRETKLDSIAPRMLTVESATTPRRLQFDTEEENISLTVQQVKALITSGYYKAGDIGILYRTNATAKPLQNELMKAGIKSRIHGAGDFWKCKATQSILCALELCENPNNVAAFSVYASGFSGISNKVIAKLLKSSEKTPLETLEQYNPNAAAKLSFRLDAISNALRSSLGKALFLIRENPDLAHDQNPGLVTATAETLEALVELKGLTSATEITEWASFSKESGEQESASCINLMTIHASKGKQFKVVFIMDASNGVMPKRGGCRNSYKSDARVMYVALTRASEVLYITHKRRQLSDYLEPFTLAFEDWSEAVEGGVFKDSFAEYMKDYKKECEGLHKARHSWVVRSHQLA